MIDVQPACREVSPLMGAILRCLANGATLTSWQLAERIYTRADDCPEWPQQTFSWTVRRFREDLARHGLAVVSQRGPGGGWRLVRAQEAAA